MATNHIQVAISASRQPKYAALTTLAANLGCRITDLVWAGVENIIKNPPKDIASLGITGAAPRSGSARGFWILHKLAENGALISSSVREVASRGEATGSMFLRYSAGDAKGRVRIMNQAVKSATYDMNLAGKVGQKVALSELADKEGKAVPKKVAAPAIDEGTKTETAKK